MFSRMITLSLSKLFRKNSSSSTLGFKSNHFHAAGVARQKKKKGKKDADTFKIIKPANCVESPDPILDPLCKVAIIAGGASGFGFEAANHLLCKGARGIIIIDEKCEEGMSATQRLRDTHGKDRAHFFHCDIRNVCHFEATVKQALLKYKKIHILFNDLDKERFPTQCIYKSDNEPNWNNTRRAVHVGMKVIGKQNGGPDGIIISCASILGFMDWPQNPCPVYCMKEPAIETTKELAKKYNVEETGVRLVTLCPVNRPFEEIGLPHFPEQITNNQLKKGSPCIPSSKWRIGTALHYVLAWANTGSAWVVEPSPCVSEIPREIHFPSKEGDKVDPKVYEKNHPCPVGLKPYCADPSKACSSSDSKNSQKKMTNKK